MATLRVRPAGVLVSTRGHRVAHRRADRRLAARSDYSTNDRDVSVEKPPSDDGAKQTPVKKVVVIGGGLAGLGCLASLSGHKHINATLLESTRVLGGRVRSKAALGALAWDQGASYFTAKDPSTPFAEVLRKGRADGVVELWAGGDASPGARVGTMCTKEEAGGHVLDESSWEPFAASKELYVGVPSMAELPVFVAEKVANAVRPEASWLGDNAVPGTPEYLTNAFADRIQALRTQDTGTWPANVPHSGSDRNWGLMIRCREGGHMWYKPWESDVVVLATQAPAAAKLTAQILKSVGADGDGGNGYGIASKILAMASAADRIRGNQCWSLTVAFAEPLNLPYEGVMMKEPFDGGIAWFANNSSKPGRPEPGKGKGAQTAGWAYRWAEVGTSLTVGQGECWVVQASPEWSNERAEMSPDDAAKELCDAFLKLVGRSESEVKPVHVKAVIWKFAYPLNPAGDPSDDSKRYLFDPDLGLGACGDWTSGPRAGDAYDSGVALGRAVAEQLASKLNQKETSESEGKAR